MGRISRLHTLARNLWSPSNHDYNVAEITGSCAWTSKLLSGFCLKRSYVWRDIWICACGTWVPYKASATPKSLPILSSFPDIVTSMLALHVLLSFAAFALAETISNSNSVIDRLKASGAPVTPQDWSPTCINSYVHPSWAGTFDYDACAYAFGEHPFRNVLRHIALRLSC